MKPISERKQISLLFWGTIFLLILMFFFGWKPAQKNQTTLRKERLSLKLALQEFEGGEYSKSLDQRYTELQTWKTRLQEELQVLKQRMLSSKKESIDGSRTDLQGGRIDYKVALLNAREMIAKQALEANAIVPDKLGMEETIGEEEDPEIRIWQLTSLVKIITTCLEVGILEIHTAKALPPLLLIDRTAGQIVFREFPVRIEMGASFEKGIQFLTRIQQKGHFHTLRGFRMENASISSDKPFPMVVVCGTQDPQTPITFIGAQEGTSNKDILPRQPRSLIRTEKEVQ